MTAKNPLMVAFFLMLISFSCKKEEVKYPISYPVKAGIVDEASGIADSKKNPGYLWVQQDGDNPTDLALISHRGEFLKKIYLKDTRNRDWEDMTLAPGPDPLLQYIYIGDTGDNGNTFGSYFIYRFPEPSKEQDTVFQFDKISFKYPDGSHDSEAFLVEPETKDIYILTKRENQSNIYLLKYPYSTVDLNTVSYVGKLPYNGVVGAAIQSDGRGLAIKTYFAIGYYTRNPGESIGEVLQKPYISLRYVPEAQGEAISFTLDNLGYYTLSERRFSDVSLNYYRK